jgi:hypothetical protein
VYSRDIDGQEYSFGVSGKLIMNVLVMYDRQTRSLWSQILGEAVEGELKGTKLEYFPSRMTTWQEWKTKYPDTVALVKGYAGSFDPYDSYYESQAPGVIGESRIDERLETKQFVVGVAHGDAAVAYPFSKLSTELVVNDQIGDLPVVVVFHDNTSSGLVFDRQVAGQTLTFVLTDKESLTLTDVETESTWDGLTGQATAGSLSGARLTQVKSTSSFWFGWKDFYPHTRVYGKDS